MSTTNIQSQHPYSATLIADYILAYNEKPLTKLDVIKLTYISHGWHLAMFNGKSLIGDQIEAWVLGPVIPTLYRALRVYKRQNIDKLIYCGTILNTPLIAKRKELMVERIHEQSRMLIDRVVGEYSHLNAMQLSALTHQPNTPWSDCYIDGQRFTPIPNNIIQRHYLKLAKERSPRIE